MQAIETLQSQQVTKDFFYTNPGRIEMTKNTEYELQTWTVPQGETMNLEVKFDTDQAATRNNAVWLYLFANDRMVVRSNDDGDGGDDNLIVSLNYRGRSMTEDVVYRLVAKPSAYDHDITPRHFQMGYTTYGVGHAWHE